MTKRNLVARIARETGVIQLDVATIVQKFLDAMVDALARGEHLEFRDFGVFKPCTRKAKVGRNPMKPAVAVPIPERRVVKFTPGRVMEARVSQA